MSVRAELWDALPDGTVACRLCAHGCLLRAGARGVCGVRRNAGGTLLSLAGDVVTAVNLDPVEKKPLYHFLPGTATFSVGSAGCNFSCRFCQNSSISCVPASGRVAGTRVRPEDLAALARAENARSLAFTYNEPTVFFELVRATANLCPDMPVILVSNGYMSRDCLHALRGLVRAANIDLKGFRDAFYRKFCGARLQPVLDTLKAVQELGWWLEVTTLVIPGINDDRQELAELAAFVHDELGADTPWHISAFHGAHLMADHPPTPLPTLQQARDAGRAAGLRFVYMGNVRCAGGGDTVCPSCGSMLVERVGYAVYRHDRAGQCPACGYLLPGVWTA